MVDEEQRRRIPLNLIKMLITAVLLALALAAWGYWGFAKNESDLPIVGLELIKASLQILTTAFLGTILAVLVKSYDYDREQTDRRLERGRQSDEKARDEERQLEESRNEFRMEVLLRLVSCFTETKRYRRLLLGEVYADDQKTQIKGCVYNEQLKALIDVELRLESTLYELVESGTKDEDADQTLGDVFDEPAVIINEMKEMRNFLRGLIHQWERMSRSFADDKHTLSLSDFTTTMEDEVGLNKLLGDAFKTDFVAHYRKAAKLIRKDMLERYKPREPQT